MILFFDTETTGLPRNWKAPVTNVNNWPRMVQLAYQFYDATGNKLAEADHIIKPDGFTISAEVSRVHGITHERAMREGVPVRNVLLEINDLANQANLLVAHNMNFDSKIIGAEFIRAGVSNPIPTKRQLCTMEKSTNYCALPGPYGYKWPKLSELHYKLFREYFDEAHNAAFDIQATVRCYWELKRLAIIN
jgi:DNA polymerase III subunit epsilon